MTYQKPRSIYKLYFYKILVFTIASLIAPPGYAGNGSGPYFTFTGSINIYETADLSKQSSGLEDALQEINANLEIDTGLGFNHSIGYRFGRSISTELEFSFKESDFGNGKGSGEKIPLDGDIDTKSFLVNGIYHFDQASRFTPYIGYGVGMAFHEATLNNHPDGEDKTFAYQLKMGFDMDFSHNMSFLIGYRFFTTDDANLDFFTLDVTTHSLEAGIKYSF